MLYTYLSVVVVLVRHGLLMHYHKDYNLLSRALTVLAVTAADPACLRAGIDGTATTMAALVSVRATREGSWCSVLLLKYNEGAALLRRN